MTQLLLFNVTNGLIIGAFYALMALGLSLILNLSNVINFAHGGFLVIGGYLAYTITPYVGFWGALLIAPVLTAVIGLAVEGVLIRPLYGRDPLYSLLMTFGLAFIIEDGTRFIWGAQGKPVTIPPFLARPLSHELFFITGYRIFMVVTVTIAVALIFALLRYTRLGIRIRAATLDLLKRLKAANVPIDALGIQSHISAGSGQTWGKGLRDLIGQAQSLGLEVSLTDLDVTADAVPGDDTAARDQIVAAVYRDYLAVALENKAVKSVLTWGLTDKRTWLNGIKSHREKLPNRPQRPLPFDPDYKPAPAFFALRDALAHAPHR